MENDDWWSINKEEKLIDLYQERLHLWDKTAPGYEMRNKRDIAVAAYAKELAISCKYYFYSHRGNDLCIPDLTKKDKKK